MKKFLIWLLAFIITILAAYYQRKTGPTYPQRLNVTLNNTDTELKLVRSLGLDERSEVKLGIADTRVKATLLYKRFKTDDEYSRVPFVYKEYPVNSYIMNRVFKMTEEKGLFADLPQQPPAGKLQYYIEITDNSGTRELQKEQPVVIRFKGAVPRINSPSSYPDNVHRNDVLNSCRILAAVLKILCLKNTEYGLSSCWQPEGWYSVRLSRNMLSEHCGRVFLLDGI